jgi:hypothetical protein
MLIRVDAFQFTDRAAFHAHLADAFGFPPSYGKNLDALVDCLSGLDDPAGGLTRVHVFPGQVLTLVIDHAGVRDKVPAELIRDLVNAAAFVNWRRLGRGQPAVLALAYDPPG